MSLGTCPKCGSPMQVKTIIGWTVWIECSNPYCDNKFGDVWEVTVTSNGGN